MCRTRIAADSRARHLDRQLAIEQHRIGRQMAVDDAEPLELKQRRRHLRAPAHQRSVVGAAGAQNIGANVAVFG